LRECEAVECEDQREAADREGAARVGDEHDALAIPAVDQRAGRKVEEHVRQRLHEADDARLRR
jgi:hypothetical protein